VDGMTPFAAGSDGPERDEALLAVYSAMSTFVHTCYKMMFSGP
jgi:hypothetical protein